KIPQKQVAAVFNTIIVGNQNTVTVHKPEPSEKVTRVNNPWLSGSFYVFVVVIVLSTIAVVSYKVPWYALPFIVITGVLMVSIIGALQSRNDDRLKEAGFLKLMLEAFKYVPL